MKEHSEFICGHFDKYTKGHDWMTPILVYDQFLLRR